MESVGLSSKYTSLFSLQINSGNPKDPQSENERKTLNEEETSEINKISVDNQTEDAENSMNTRCQIKNEKNFLMDSKLITKNKLRLIHFNLLVHSINEREFSIKLVNDIIYNENKRTVSIFKDHLIYNDPAEFLRFYYDYEESADIITKWGLFFNENYLIPLSPNYAKLELKNLLLKNLQKKLKLREKLFNNYNNINNLDNANNNDSNFNFENLRIKNDLSTSKNNTFTRFIDPKLLESSLKHSFKLNDDLSIFLGHNIKNLNENLTHEVFDSSENNDCTLILNNNSLSNFISIKRINTLESSDNLTGIIAQKPGKTQFKTIDNNSIFIEKYIERAPTPINDASEKSGFINNNHSIYLDYLELHSQGSNKILFLEKSFIKENDSSKTICSKYLNTDKYYDKNYFIVDTNLIDDKKIPQDDILKYNYGERKISNNDKYNHYILPLDQRINRKNKLKKSENEIKIHTLDTENLEISNKNVIASLDCLESQTFQFDNHISKDLKAIKIEKEGLNLNKNIIFEQNGICKNTAKITENKIQLESDEKKIANNKKLVFSSEYKFISDNKPLTESYKLFDTLITKQNKINEISIKGNFNYKNCEQREHKSKNPFLAKNNFSPKDRKILSPLGICNNNYQNIDSQIVDYDSHKSKELSKNQDMNEKAENKMFKKSHSNSIQKIETKRSDKNKLLKYHYIVNNLFYKEKSVRSKSEIIKNKTSFNKEIINNYPEVNKNFRLNVFKRNFSVFMSKMNNLIFNNFEDPKNNDHLNIKCNETTLRLKKVQEKIENNVVKKFISDELSCKLSKLDKNFLDKNSFDDKCRLQKDEINTYQKFNSDKVTFSYRQTKTEYESNKEDLHSKFILEKQEQKFDKQYDLSSKLRKNPSLDHNFNDTKYKSQQPVKNIITTPNNPPDKENYAFNNTVKDESKCMERNMIQEDNNSLNNSNKKNEHLSKFKAKNLTNKNETSLNKDFRKNHVKNDHINNNNIYDSIKDTQTFSSNEKIKTFLNENIKVIDFNFIKKSNLSKNKDLNDLSINKHQDFSKEKDLQKNNFDYGYSQNLVNDFQNNEMKTKKDDVNFISQKVYNNSINQFIKKNYYLNSIKKGEEKTKKTKINNSSLLFSNKNCLEELRNPHNEVSQRGFNNNMTNHNPIIINNANHKNENNMDNFDSGIFEIKLNSSSSPDLNINKNETSKLVHNNIDFKKTSHTKSPFDMIKSINNENSKISNLNCFSNRNNALMHKELFYSILGIGKKSIEKYNLNNVQNNNANNKCSKKNFIQEISLKRNLKKNENNYIKIFNNSLREKNHTNLNQKLPNKNYSIKKDTINKLISHRNYNENKVKNPHSTSTNKKEVLKNIKYTTIIKKFSNFDTKNSKTKNAAIYKSEGEHSRWADTSKFKYNTNLDNNTTIEIKKTSVLANRKDIFSENLRNQSFCKDDSLMGISNKLNSKSHKELLSFDEKNQLISFIQDENNSSNKLDFSVSQNNKTNNQQVSFNSSNFIPSKNRIISNETIINSPFNNTMYATNFNKYDFNDKLNAEANLKDLCSENVPNNYYMEDSLCLPGKENYTFRKAEVKEISKDDINNSKISKKYINNQRFENADKALLDFYNINYDDEMIQNMDIVIKDNSLENNIINNLLMNNHIKKNRNINKNVKKINKFNKIDSYNIKHHLKKFNSNRSENSSCKPYYSFRDQSNNINKYNFNKNNFKTDNMGHKIQLNREKTTQITKSNGKNQYVNNFLSNDHSPISFNLEHLNNSHHGSQAYLLKELNKFNSKIENLPEKSLNNINRTFKTNVDFVNSDMIDLNDSNPIHKNNINFIEQLNTKITKFSNNNKTSNTVISLQKNNTYRNKSYAKKKGQLNFNKKPINNLSNRKNNFDISNLLNNTASASKLKNQINLNINSNEFKKNVNLKLEEKLNHLATTRGQIKNFLNIKNNIDINTFQDNCQVLDQNINNNNALINNNLILFTDSNIDDNNQRNVDKYLQRKYLLNIHNNKHEVNVENKIIITEDDRSNLINVERDDHELVKNKNNNDLLHSNFNKDNLSSFYFLKFNSHRNLAEQKYNNNLNNQFKLNINSPDNKGQNSNFNNQEKNRIINVKNMNSTLSKSEDSNNIEGNHESLTIIDNYEFPNKTIHQSEEPVKIELINQKNIKLETYKIKSEDVFNKFLSISPLYKNIQSSIIRQSSNKKDENKTNQTNAIMQKSPMNMKNNNFDYDKNKKPNNIFIQDYYSKIINSQQVGNNKSKNNDSNKNLKNIYIDPKDIIVKKIDDVKLGSQRRNEKDSASLKNDKIINSKPKLSYQTKNKNINGNYQTSLKKHQQRHNMEFNDFLEKTNFLFESLSAKNINNNKVLGLKINRITPNNIQINNNIIINNNNRVPLTMNFGYDQNTNIMINHNNVRESQKLIKSQKCIDYNENMNHKNDFPNNRQLKEYEKNLIYHQRQDELLKINIPNNNNIVSGNYSARNINFVNCLKNRYGELILNHKINNKNNY